MKKKLIGAVIGLARATDGNEHLITADTTAVICASLNAQPDTPESLDLWLNRLEEAKKKIVPDCFLCESPCGRTNPYDLTEINQESQDIRNIKYQILDEVLQLARQTQSVCRDQKIYRGLIAIGMDGCDAKTLHTIFSK